MELLTEKITLPSGRTLSIREMTAIEESYLTNPKLVNSGEAFDKILSNCIIDKDIDIEDILVGDRYYLVLSIRRITFGDNYDFKVKCDECGKTLDIRIKLSELEIKKLENDDKGTFEITLPRSGKIIKFRLLRGRDEKKIADMLRKNPQDIIRYSLFLHTLSIDGDTNFDEKSFDSLPAMDSVYYRNMIADCKCGVDTTVAIQCSQCGDSFEVEMPLTEHFFFPSSRKNSC